MVLTHVIEGWGSNSLPESAGLNLTGVFLCVSKPWVVMQTSPLTSRGKWTQRKVRAVAQLLHGGISPLLVPVFLASISPVQWGWGSSQLFPLSPAAALSLPPQHPTGVARYISRKADGIHWCTARSKTGHHATSAIDLALHDIGVHVGEAS